MTLTTKLIDGTFPDYGRVIPLHNDKRLIVDKESFQRAVDRVSTISSERGRAIKLSIADGRMTLSVNNPDSGSASEELEVDYDSAPIDIGFNARYLLDIAQQLSGDTALIKLSDPGSPTIIQDREGVAGAVRADAAEGVRRSFDPTTWVLAQAGASRSARAARSCGAGSKDCTAHVAVSGQPAKQIQTRQAHK